MAPEDEIEAVLPFNEEDLDHKDTPLRWWKVQ
jgi:hypothetical protein